MATLRDIRDRIKSVKNTRQITRAMKLVAGAKLNKATQAALAARPYQQTLRRVLGQVVGAVGEEFQHPLLQPTGNTEVVYVLALSADRGLCGNFNSLVNKAAELECRRLQAGGKTVKVLAFGKKVRAHLSKRGFDVIGGEVDVDPREYGRVADALASRLVDDLHAAAFEQVVLVYNRYESVMVQTPITEVVLPMAIARPAAVEGEAEGAGPSVDYLFEPDGASLLGHLLPLSLRTRLLQALLENQAGEQAKRMTAMDAATRNASELISRLSLEYNRARQAAITKELIEIISGAQAL
jgi:F-type H+-transporting ATPase subunit gamma